MESSFHQNNPETPHKMVSETPENNEKSTRMEIEQPVQTPVNLQRPDIPSVGKQSPAKLIKSSPNKEFSSFNQPEEHITIIFSSFKDAIRNADTNRLREILQKYQEKYDLTNRLDPVSKHISTFLASEIKDDQKCYEILSLLLQFKANAHFVDSMKQSILFYLAKEGHLRCLDLLISRGISPEDSDIHGQTPLYYAARDGKADAIRLLIQRGADVNHKDNISNQTCLFYAARDGRYEACKAILENGGLPTHVDNKKQTPLHWAKRHNKKDVIELLQMYTGGKHENRGNAEKNKGKSVKNSGNTITMGSSGGNAQQNQKQTVFISETPYVEPSHSMEMGRGKNLGEQQNVGMGMGSMEKETNNSVHNSTNNQSILKKRKREKYEAKISYKLVYTDDFGKSSELTNGDFEKFKEKYPDIAEMMLKADSLINESLIKENKEKETWEKVAKKILNNLWKLKGAFYFHTAVDPIRLKIEDYFNIVKKPMDFGTIKTKLNTNVYKHPQEFITDMNLVFTNCVLYNGSESEVGKIGLAIQREFDNTMKINGFSRFFEERNEPYIEEKDLLGKNENLIV